MFTTNGPAVLGSIALVALMASQASVAQVTARDDSSAELTAADFECLDRLAAVRPSLSLSVNYIGGLCRVRPSTAAASWLTDQPLTRRMALAIDQRLAVPGTVAPLDTVAMPSVGPEVCAALREHLTAPSAGACQLAGIDSAAPMPPTARSR